MQANSKPRPPASDGRLQLSSLAYTASSRNLFALNYFYKQDSTNCPNGAAGNNDQIQCIVDTPHPGRSVSYSYDSLARLATAVTAGDSSYAQWGLSWVAAGNGYNGYDRYGNRQSQAVTAGSAPSPCLAINPANNQITGSCSTSGGFSYDANGNMTNDGVNVLTYDAENHAVTANSGNTYAYDGKGLRVQKVASGATTSYIFSGSKVIAEYDGSGSLKTEYIYAGDQLLASTWGLSNPGFEEGLTGWQTYGSATLETNSSLAHSGNDCVQLSTTTYADVAFSEYFPVTSGQQVNFGGWAYRVSGSTGYARWKLVELDSNYNPVAYPDPSPNNESAGSWTYQSGSVTIPSGVAYVRLYAEIWNVSDTVTANFDDGFISAGGTNYYLRDHLSARVIADANGNVIGQQGHFPFGEAWYNANVTSKWLFTSYERDSETANDYAQARYYVNRLGRFNSPDPGEISADPTDPQTWNAYSYVRNDPISMVDPTGADGDMFEDCWHGQPGQDSLLGVSFYDAYYGGCNGGPGDSLPDWGPLCEAGNTGCSEGSGQSGFSIGIDVGGLFGGDNSPLGESNGLPSGISVPPVTIHSVLFGNSQCEFGACFPASGFQSCAEVTCPKFGPSLPYLSWLAGLLGPNVVFDLGGQAKQKTLPPCDSPDPKVMADAGMHANQTFFETIGDDVIWGVGGAFGVGCFVGSQVGGPLGCAVVGSSAAVEAFVPTTVIGIVHGTYNAYKEAWTHPTCQ